MYRVTHSAASYILHASIFYTVCPLRWPGPGRLGLVMCLFVLFAKRLIERRRRLQSTNNLDRPTMRLRIINTDYLAVMLQYYLFFSSQ